MQLYNKVYNLLAQSGNFSDVRNKLKTLTIFNGLQLLKDNRSSKLRWFGYLSTLNVTFFMIQNVISIIANRNNFQLTVMNLFILASFSILTLFYLDLFKYKLAIRELLEWCKTRHVFQQKLKVSGVKTQAFERVERVALILVRVGLASLAAYTVLTFIGGIIFSLIQGKYAPFYEIYLPGYEPRSTLVFLLYLI